MSQPGRVHSKNLFHHLRLDGQYDPELLADMAKTKDLMGPMMAKMGEALKVHEAVKKTSPIFRFFQTPHT